MKVEEQPKLRFNGVDIINVNFSSERPLEKDVDLDLNIQPKVFYPENDELFFKIIMEFSLGAQDYFHLEMLALGTFQFDQEVDQEIRKKFANMNAPAIMFPYIRSFVSSFTSNLGNVTGNIVLPTQFFDGELEEVKNFEKNISSD